MNKSSLIAATVLAVFVSGCATNQGDKNKAASFEAERTSQQILADLDRSADSAINAQRELALAQDAKVRRQSDLRKKFLTDKSSLNFTGDVEQVLKMMAEQYEYDFIRLGQRPADGVVVSVYANNRPTVDLLKFIAYNSPLIDVRLTDSQIILYYKDGKKLPSTNFRPVVKSKVEVTGGDE